MKHEDNASYLIVPLELKLLYFLLLH